MQVVAPPPKTPYPLPLDKPTLAKYIKEAALLEQQFMCQYLYAAFSLKKQPDATCSPAQTEVVRRWASQIYMIARQEMEHLSIANSLLTAIGYDPWFGHDNFPTQSRWYTSEALGQKNRLLQNAPEPCDFPFLLQAFDLTVARRFCCMESPTLQYVRQADQQNVLHWCYKTAPDSCGCTPNLLQAVPRSFSFLDDLDAAANDVQPGTVQEVYEAIAGGLTYLNAKLGSKALFSGHESGQSQIPSEYDIYLFPICNLDTALAGIRLITQQGEGIKAPPGYDSHFQNYYDIVAEYTTLLAEDPTFQPALPVPLNPDIDQYTINVTKLAVHAFNTGYVATLYMLAAYYANYRSAAYQKAPYLFQALEQTVFAPVMTMLIRSLAELIVQMPADESGAPAGPTFYLTKENLELLSQPTNPLFLDLNFHISNLAIVAGRLKQIIDNPGPAKALEPKFRYIRENVVRMIMNLNYIYTNATYPKFVNLPACAQDDNCG